MARMTKQQINAYEKAWRKERERIRKFASTLRKRGYILAEDFIPPLKPSRRTKAALKKITEFRGREYYSKASYPKKTGGIAKGYSSKSAYEADLKVRRQRQAEKNKGFPSALPKGKTEGEEKDYIIFDTGVIVDRRTGEVVDGLMYDKKKGKILDVESGEEFDGYLKQGENAVDTETGEIKDIDSINVDIFENLKNDLNNLFSNLKEEISQYDWYMKQAELNKNHQHTDVRAKIQELEDTIAEKINSLEADESGLEYKNYLETNMEKINSAIQTAYAHSEGTEVLKAIDEAIHLITQNDIRSFDSGDVDDYGVDAINGEY